MLRASVGLSSSSVAWPVMARTCRTDALVLGGDAAEDRVAHRGVGDELGVARRDREIGLGEHHRHVRQHAAEERPALVHLGEQREPAGAPAACAARNASTAVPKPYHPGSISRHWPQLNTHGIARRSSIRVDAVRDAGRLPMLSSAISAIGVAARKYSTNSGVS